LALQQSQSSLQSLLSAEAPVAEEPSPFFIGHESPQQSHALPSACWPSLQQHDVFACSPVEAWSFDFIGHESFDLQHEALADMGAVF
jgi:hypothetical protein